MRDELVALVEIGLKYIRGSCCPAPFLRGLFLFVKEFIGCSALGTLELTRVAIEPLFTCVCFCFDNT